MGRDHERERALVVAALSGVLERCWALDALATVDWEWILLRLRAHGLGGRFWSEALRAGLREALPVAVTQALAAEAQETAASNAALVHMGLTACAALDQAGVPSMPMKGVAIALTAPEYGATRAMSDVDLLVHPRDLARARETLVRAFPHVRELRDYDGADREADQALRDEVPSLYTFLDEAGAVLELHHAFPGILSREGTEAAFERSRTVVARGRTVRVPGFDDLLGTACVHVLVHHDEGERGMRLRHLADVSALLAAGASADVARQRYDVAGADSVARSLELLAEGRRDATVRGGARSAASVALDPGTGRRLRVWAANLLTRGGRFVTAFRKHGVGAVIPPRSFMVGLYGPAAAGPRLPLLHLHRWASIVRRAVQGRR